VFPLRRINNHHPSNDPLPLVTLSNTLLRRTSVARLRSLFLQIPSGFVAPSLPITLQLFVNPSPHVILQFLPSQLNSIQTGHPYSLCLYFSYRTPGSISSQSPCRVHGYSTTVLRDAIYCRLASPYSAGINETAHLVQRLLSPPFDQRPGIGLNSYISRWNLVATLAASPSLLLPKTTIL
jgi:hypothetical protein